MQSIPEKELVDRLKNRDEAAFRYVYEKCFPMAVHYITKNSGTQQDAEDTFQEALIALTNNLYSGDFELKSKLSTYLYAIVRNKWLYKLRGSKREVSLNPDIDVGDEDHSEEQKLQEQRLSVMAEVLRTLSEECQKVIVGFYYRKEKLADLADQLGYTSAFIRIKKMRCMKEYRDRVRNHPDIGSQQ